MDKDSKGENEEKGSESIPKECKRPFLRHAL